MEKAKIKPGRWLYWIGALLIVAGIVISVAVAANGAMAALGNSQKVQVPGTSSLELSKTGAYTLTYSKDASGNPVTSGAAYAGLAFSLKDSSGAAVAMKNVRGLVETFTIKTPGTYTLTAAYASGTSPSATMLLMAASSINTTLITVLFWVFLLAGVALIIVTAVLRRKNRKLSQD